MADCIFLIAVDIGDTRLDHDRVRQFIKTSPDFIGWWNYIPAVYLVHTTLSADEISERLEEHTTKARFFVMQVDPQNSQGWLPAASWQWIKRHEHLVEIPQPT